MTKPIAPAGSSTRTSAADDCAQISIHDISGALENVLGRELLSFIVGAGGGMLPEWITGESMSSAGGERRLRSAYEVYALLRAEEDDRTIRARFMGMNSELDDVSPAEAIAGDQLRKVMIAARAFAAGG
ncbi:hypothetical protein [Salinibacterium sp. SWN167]|uniref:hypothetical protein n=1 Tax=Salinibacterium sp. SWN167 TaxID=2792054 RepID=UPI0018CF40EA|nr:hypothetical protein [Salinibacterium sp. SWN167]MBH0083310.1 hypothetical protein [Salinibacterium sp. SWN167]